ncbi:DUF2849 domain-containing protein [Xanthobacter sp. KR7-225]|uniref:DUF2849 domain-containing protein n=1 Tax=Xanthobacter sp. KR7-225 TaxID=3156613 RepID=UPI0032B365CD
MTSPLQRKLKIAGPTVVTANRLADGAVVWLGKGGRWTDRIAEAEVATTADAALHLLDLAHADERAAVGAYPATVALSAAGVPQPATLRERIRTAGPTVTLPGAL